MDGSSTMISVVKTSVNAHALRHTGELKVEGTVVRLVSVEKASLLCRRKLQLERNVLGLISAEKTSA